MSSVRALCVSLIAFVIFACGGSTEPAPQPPVTEARVPVAPPSSGLVIADVTTGTASAGPVPVTGDDPSRGSDAAPVTLVMFGDFECPYSARAARTVEDLQAKYGPERLRVVFKHHPLPFRKIAPMMHEEAAAAFRAGGNPAFWAYFHHVFVESDRADGFDVIRERALGAASEASPELEQRWNDAVRTGAAEKVAADIALGKENGVRGTPAFFINGVFLGGSQDQSKFEAVIDAELQAARPKLVGGRAPAGWYAARTAENRKNAPPPQESKRPEPPPPDLTVWKVPVGKSPVRGPADALVTIVAFGDFQCPFTAKAQATLAELMKRYPADVRVVFKHRPLSFHKQAEPAHELAQEVFAKKGNEAFWRAHDMLFESSSNLDEATLTRVAKEAGLSPQTALAAVKAQKHRKLIVEDELLAEGVEAASTPHFFVNGRRLVGARKIEEFVALVDERLAEAKTIEQGGVARAKVYDEIMKSAKAGTTPEKRKAPPVPASAPFRGAKDAPVVIQVFSDLQCPFCKKAFTMLPALEKEFPGQLKIVWRDLPLPMHKQAQPAAVALREVHRLKGNDAFWKMVDALYDKQHDMGPELWEKAAADLGVEPSKLRAADGSSASGRLVEAELAAAKQLDVKATPSIFVNDYFVSGAHEAKLRAAIKRALGEKKGR